MGGSVPAALRGPLPVLVALPLLGVAQLAFGGSDFFLYIASLVGVTYGQIKQPADASWILYGLKAFVAAVIGGIGNLRGAMAGGLMIGLVELFGAAYLSPHLRDVYVFTLLIAVLLFRPSGLLGRATVEKV